MNNKSGNWWKLWIQIVIKICDRNLPSDVRPVIFSLKNINNILITQTFLTIKILF